MKARVVFNGKMFNEIPIDNGVKQGDILAPIQFSIFCCDADSGILETVKRVSYFKLKLQDLLPKNIQLSNIN